MKCVYVWIVMVACSTIVRAQCCGVPNAMLSDTRLVRDSVTKVDEAINTAWDALTQQQLKQSFDWLIDFDKDLTSGRMPNSNAPAVLDRYTTDCAKLLEELGHVLQQVQSKPAMRGRIEFEGSLTYQELRNWEVSLVFRVMLFRVYRHLQTGSVDNAGIELARAWKLNDFLLRTHAGTESIQQCCRRQVQLMTLFRELLARNPEQSSIPVLNTDYIAVGKPFVRETILASLDALLHFPEVADDARRTIVVTKQIFADMPQDDLGIIVHFRKAAERIPTSEAPELRRVMETVLSRNRINLDRAAVAGATLYHQQPEPKSLSDSEFQNWLSESRTYVPGLQVEVISDDVLQFRCPDRQYSKESQLWLRVFHRDIPLHN